MNVMKYIYRIITFIVCLSATIVASAQFKVVVYNANDSVVIPTDKVDSITFDMTPDMQAQMRMYKTVKVLTHETIGSNHDALVDSLQKQVAFMKDSIENIQRQNDNLTKKLDDLDTSNNALSGKTVWTLWDSLGGNTWQNYFMQISGCKWYESLNCKSDKPLSWGGSNSQPATDDGTQARAINLVSYKGTYPIDYVLIENVNDKVYIDSKDNIDTIPFMRSQKIMIKLPITSATELQKHVTEHFSEILETVDKPKRKKGTILAFPYESVGDVFGSKITFNGEIINDGTITITWDGGKYATEISKTMSVDDAINEILKWSFGVGTTDLNLGNNSMSICYYTSTAKRVTNVDCGTTGLTATIQDSQGSGNVYRYFMGTSEDEWNDPSKWQSYLSLYSIYKGLVEYLQTELPTAKIYFVTPYSMSVDYSSDEYRNADGSWSKDKFVESNTYKTQEALRQIHRNICKRYNIEHLDLVEHLGIDICNMEYFFPSNNVHPNEEGFKRYAETIFKLLK